MTEHRDRAKREIQLTRENGPAENAGRILRGKALRIRSAGKGLGYSNKDARTTTALYTCERDRHFFFVAYRQILRITSARALGNHSNWRQLPGSNVVC